MERLRLSKIGNEYSVIIPESMIKRLNLAEGDALFALDEEDGYKLTPYDPNFDEAMRAAEDGMRRYRNTLRELGK